LALANIKDQCQHGEEISAIRDGGGDTQYCI
jgi:hypothetical protein